MIHPPREVVSPGLTRHTPSPPSPACPSTALRHGLAEERPPSLCSRPVRLLRRLTGMAPGPPSGHSPGGGHARTPGVSREPAKDERKHVSCLLIHHRKGARGRRIALSRPDKSADGQRPGWCVPTGCPLVLCPMGGCHANQQAGEENVLRRQRKSGRTRKRTPALGKEQPDCRYGRIGAIPCARTRPLASPSFGPGRRGDDVLTFSA